MGKAYLNGVVKLYEVKSTMKTLSVRKMLILSATAAVVWLPSLRLNKNHISRFK